MRGKVPARKIYLIVIAAISLTLVSLLSACGRSSARSTEKSSAGSANSNSAAASAPVPVAVATANARDVSAYIQATGSLSADETSDVAPQASGQVISTPVDAGAFVKQGAVIVRLDDRDARLRLQQAIGAERQAQSGVRQAEERLGLRGGRFDSNAVPEVRAAYQQYQAAEAQAVLAETNARRYANLVETGDVPRSQFDQARAQAETARAQANAARQNYELQVNIARQNNQGIATAQAQLEQARAQVALARKAVNDTTVTAPFSGYISDRPVAKGEYVTPASKIATVLLTNPIKLKLQLPEAEAARVKIGMTVKATVAAFPGREFEGKVTAVNPAIDLTSRTITVEASLGNSDNALKSGMFATARVLLPEGGQGVFVPRTAVMTDPNTNASSVYVIEGNTARLRVVQTGDEDADSIRIVTGVNAGETVAFSNLDKLFDGATVAPQ